MKQHTLCLLAPRGCVGPSAKIARATRFSLQAARARVLSPFLSKFKNSNDTPISVAPFFPSLQDRLAIERVMDRRVLADHPFKIRAPSDKPFCLRSTHQKLSHSLLLLSSSWRGKGAFISLLDSIYTQECRYWILQLHSQLSQTRLGLI